MRTRIGELHNLSKEELIKYLMYVLGRVSQFGKYAKMHPEDVLNCIIDECEGEEEK